MTKGFTRRTFLNTAAAGAGAAALPGLLGPARAQAATLTGVQWGGPWVESAKKITEADGRWNVNWELHAGGSATIIPKIRAVWPNPLYDFVAQWSLLYPVWVEQDWPETLTTEDMPVFKDMPEEIFYRNDKGDIVNAPMSLAASAWGYRKDLMPIEIEKTEDLLDPKLRGKVIIRDAVAGNALVTHFALAFGGNENNMEPGWDFLKRLASSGNVGRVASTEVDFINSITSGECVVGLWNTGSWRSVSENFPVEYIIKDQDVTPGFPVGLHNEGYMIPRVAAKKDDAKAYINWFLNAENNEAYNKAIGYIPVNLKSSPSEFAKKFFFTDADERRRFTHNYAFDVLVRKQTEMISRFEAEIIPLLR